MTVWVSIKEEREIASWILENTRVNFAGSSRVSDLGRHHLDKTEVTQYSYGQVFRHDDRSGQVAHFRIT